MHLQERTINYQWLAFAVKYFSDLGYEQVEVPWIVTSEASLATAPEDGIFKVDGEHYHLVGSAEQGFIDNLIIRPNVLRDDYYYFSVSPCFRKDMPSSIYSQWFVKLELFYKCKDTIPPDPVLDFIQDAHKLHYLLVPYASFEAITTKDGMDLMYGDLELGSYGTRAIGDQHYCYGTGIALPRAQLITLNKSEW